MKNISISNVPVIILKLLSTVIKKKMQILKAN